MSQVRRGQNRIQTTVGPFYPSTSCWFTQCIHSTSIGQSDSGLWKTCLPASAALLWKVSPIQGCCPSRYTPPQLQERAPKAIWPLQTPTHEATPFPIKCEVSSSVVSVFVVETCVPGNALFLTLPLNLSYVSGLLFQHNVKRAACCNKTSGLRATATTILFCWRHSH